MTKSKLKPGSKEWMLAKGFIWDPARGHARWTLFPTKEHPMGITVLRAPYMDEAQWEQAKIEVGNKVLQR